MENEIKVTDSTGRELTIAALDPGDILDFIESAGSAADSPRWMMQAMFAVSVREIDGIPVKFPANKNEVKTLSRKLGHHGLKAVREALGVSDKDPESDEAAAADTYGADLAAAKN